MKPEHHERLEAMVSPNQQTWDLSPNDVEAIKAVLKAVDELFLALSSIVTSLPTCDRCRAPATKAFSRGSARFCDEHGVRQFPNGVGPYVGDAPDYPRAKAIREAAILLARLRGEEWCRPSMAWAGAAWNGQAQTDPVAPKPMEPTLCDRQAAALGQMCLLSERPEAPPKMQALAHAGVCAAPIHHDGVTTWVGTIKTPDCLTCMDRGRVWEGDDGETQTCPICTKWGVWLVAHDAHEWGEPVRCMTRRQADGLAASYNAGSVWRAEVRALPTSENP